MNTRHLFRPFSLLVAVIGLSVVAPRVNADALLFWNFENQSSSGDISTSIGTPGVSGITGFASQTGGGPAEDFGAPFGWLHLTRFFGLYYPYAQFTLTRPMLVQTVTFDHIHNHNDGYSTYPSYKAQLQLDTDFGSGSGYADIGGPLLLEGSNQYHSGASISLNVVLNAGTHAIRWMPRELNPGDGYYDTPRNTSSEYFALNNLRLNGSAFAWSGFLQPINMDGSSVFKAGSTVPVKFQLTGAWAGITDLVATLSYRKISDGVPGDVNEASSTSAATAGNEFRSGGGQYLFNWSTKGLAAGTYRLEVRVGSTVVGTVDLGLK